MFNLIKLKAKKVKSTEKFEKIIINLTNIVTEINGVGSCHKLGLIFNESIDEIFELLDKDKFIKLNLMNDLSYKFSKNIVPIENIDYFMKYSHIDEKCNVKSLVKIKNDAYEYFSDSTVEELEELLTKKKK